MEVYQAGSFKIQQISLSTGELREVLNCGTS